MAPTSSISGFLTRQRRCALHALLTRPRRKISAELMDWSDTVFGKRRRTDCMHKALMELLLGSGRRKKHKYSAAHSASIRCAEKNLWISTRCQRNVGNLRAASPGDNLKFRSKLSALAPGNSVGPETTHIFSTKKTQHTLLAMLARPTYLGVSDSVNP